MFKSMLIKEFLLVLRDKHALAALFVMPAVFILIMSLALKDVFSDEKAMISLAMIDQDQTDTSEMFTDLLGKNKLISSQLLTEDESKNVDQQGVQFLLSIPKGYEKEANLPLQVQVASDVSQSVLLLFKAQIMQLVMQHKTVTFHLEQQSKAKKMGVTLVDPISIDEKEVLNIQYATLSEDEKPTSTQQSVPSWIVFGLFFVIIPMSTIFISERKQNTLMRLSTMNITIPALFAGKIIPYMIINQLQVWLMIAVGMFVVPLFGAAPLAIGGSVIALVCVSLALSLAAIGLSILIATAVDSIEQATTIGGIINVLLGAIGGVMVPKFIMPEFMQSFANVSPMSWGLEGFLDIFLRKGDLLSVLNEVFALTLFGLLMLFVAAIIFKKKIREIS